MAAILYELEHHNQWPHVINRRISISQLLSLRRHSHYDVPFAALEAPIPTMTSFFL